MSYLQHVRQDSKAIWGVIMVIGVITGNVDRIGTVLTPSLDETFVTEEELNNTLIEVYDKIREVEGRLPANTNTEAVVPVDPNGTIPRIRRDSRET